ncbi:MAG TPA: hypothetical protein VKR58_15420 [Aquella sp.]|jgi:hypothetical protein|nr:hypothetical protein [Aquella sp.]
MTKEFFLMREADSQGPARICFSINNVLMPIEYLSDNSNKDELLSYVKSLNNYAEVLDFVKSIPCPGKPTHNCIYGDTDLCEKASELLKEIGELE